MSKVKSSQIPHYELLYLISNKFSENELGPIVEKVKKIITDNEGKITYSEDWGKRRLSYPVKGFYHGYYSLAEFDVAGSQLAKIDRSLRMAGEILRHQIVSKKVKTAKEIEREKKIAAKIAAKAKEESVKEEEAPKEKEKERVDMKELDEKLDKILETSDLL